jgi:hypothetical protein
MSCPFLDSCPMFRMLALDEEQQYLAWAFCCGEHSDCGRYKRMLAGEPVPQGLKPTGEIVPLKRELKS